MKQERISQIILTFNNKKYISEFSIVYNNDKPSVKVDTHFLQQIDIDYLYLALIFIDVDNLKVPLFFSVGMGDILIKQNIVLN